MVLPRDGAPARTGREGRKALKTNVIQIHAHGGPDRMQLEQVELPAPAPGEALVRNTAIGVNYADIYEREGDHGGPHSSKPFPIVMGHMAAGVVESGRGKVRLLRWAEYPDGWDPKADARTPVWEAAHHLIRALNRAGEAEAGALLARMPERGEAIRQLAYHLYTLCERKKWADDARAYNELITAWHAIVAASHETGHRGAQVALGFE